MASSCLSEDLTCSICLSVYTDPVIIPCGHSFCKECISVSLDQHKQCPVCRAPVETGGRSLPTNHVLKSLVEKTKQKMKYRHDKEKAEILCSEHDEKLKLYCITDQQLICVICRDAKKHESHQFKPVNEATELVRAELENLVQKISADTEALEALVQSQNKEVDNTKKRSEELESLISSKFKEMYKFLQKRERELSDKVKSDEKDGLKKMLKTQCDIEAAIAENKKLEATVTSVVQIQNHERFLQTWSEEKEAKAAKCSFVPKAEDFQVEKTDLSLGPYESHLQMFVWKEMLQVVTPREEELLLRIDQTSPVVSQDQRSATFCYNLQQQQYNQQCLNCGSHNLGHSYSIGIRYDNNVSNQLPSSTQSTNAFEGQHYWEVYVGKNNHWKLGLPESYMKHISGTYQIYSSGHTTSPAVQGKPQKIGCYLNSPRKELSFYDADNMKLIHTVSLASTAFPVSAHFKLGNSCHHDPLVVCRY